MHGKLARRWIKSISSNCVSKGLVWPVFAAGDAVALVLLPLLVGFADLITACSYPMQSRGDQRDQHSVNLPRSCKCEYVMNEQMITFLVSGSGAKQRKNNKTNPSLLFQWHKLCRHFVLAKVPLKKNLPASLSVRATQQLEEKCVLCIYAAFPNPWLNIAWVRTANIENHRNGFSTVPGYL